MLKHYPRVWALCRSIQFSLFYSHGMVLNLFNLLLMYVHEEGREGKARDKSTTNSEKTNKTQSTDPTKSVMSSLRTESNALMHSKAVKILGLPDDSLTTGKINIQRLSKAEYSTVKSGNARLLRSSTVHMKTHSFDDLSIEMFSMY